MQLKPTPPRNAKNQYLKKKQSHASDKTYYNYDTVLKQFLEYLDGRIDDMNDVDSDEIVRFEEWRLADVKRIICRNNIRTVKDLIQFCETIQAVSVGPHELVEPKKSPKTMKYVTTFSPVRKPPQFSITTGSTSTPALDISFYSYLEVWYANRWPSGPRRWRS